MAVSGIQDLTVRKKNCVDNPNNLSEFERLLSSTCRCVETRTKLGVVMRATPPKMSLHNRAELDAKPRARFIAFEAQC